MTGVQGRGAKAAQVEQPSPSPQKTWCDLWGQRQGLPTLMKWKRMFGWVVVPGSSVLCLPSSVSVFGCDNDRALAAASTSSPWVIGFLAASARLTQGHVRNLWGSV